MTALAQQHDLSEIVERVIIHGDLRQLSAEQKTQYYFRVCESVGLNPLTRPFDYIVLNGKETLYAKRDATDQLRKKHNISIKLGESQIIEGVYVIRAFASDPTGRTDEATGAVNISGLKGEALANAIMKAETKAKRRATLSICGLGFLDESEVESITKSNGTTNQTTTQIPNVAEATIVSPDPESPPACPSCGQPFSVSRYPDRVTGVKGWYCFSCKIAQAK